MTCLALPPAIAEVPSKAPRALLVQVLRGGRQALMLDRVTGEFQVVKIGDTVQGFRVAEIEDDQIVLVSPSAPDRLFVLPLIEADAKAAGAANKVPAPASQPSGPAAAGGSDVAPAPQRPEGETAVGSASAGPVGATGSAGPGSATTGSDGVIDAYQEASPTETMLDPYGAAMGSSGADALDIPSVIAPPGSRAPDPTPGAASAASVAPASPSAPAASVAPAAPGAPAATTGSGGAALGGDPERSGIGVDSVSGAAAASARAGGASGKVPLAPSADGQVTALAPTEVRPGSARQGAGAGGAVGSSGSAGSARGAVPEQVRKLSRRQLDAELADFSVLARQMTIEVAAGGGVLISTLERSSFVAQVGFEAGDVIRRVAGHAVDTIDEAAAAYAALASAKEVLVEIERRGAPLRIRYQLTR